MSKHTPGPWELRTHNYANYRDALGIFPVGKNTPIVDGVWGRNLTESDENARRIVACVNACEGIPTEHLEQYQVGELLEVLEQREDTLSETVTDNGKLLQQRDKLLAASTSARDGIRDLQRSIALAGLPAVTRALLEKQAMKLDDAIAKTKGG